LPDLLLYHSLGLSGKMKKNSIISILLLLIVSCSTSPEPLSYGSDACHFCKMTIMDPNYGAELITPKGKIFKFDAVECMINYRKQNSEQVDGSSLYVINYNDPHYWIKTENAMFLRSQKLPSPMGQFITAFDSMDAAKKVQLEMGGEIQNFEEVVASMSGEPMGLK